MLKLIYQLPICVDVCNGKWKLCFRADQMMIVASDYKLSIFEGTEQYAKPHRLVTHPLYNRTTNNADIMLIKVLHKFIHTLIWPISYTTICFLFVFVKCNDIIRYIFLCQKKSSQCFTLLEYPYLSVTRHFTRNQTMTVDFDFKSATLTVSERPVQTAQQST